MMTMISQTKLNSLRIWFKHYVNSFYRDGNNAHYQLKADHTHRVCSAIKDIATHEGFSKQEQIIAEIIALFHDVGRFEQYQKYGTFVDAKSENHAEMGVHVIQQHKLLKDIPVDITTVIMTSILNHNKAEIDGDIDTKTLKYCKLIRDADKVDIYKVVTDYYNRTDRSTNPTIQLDLPDTPEISEKVAGDILSGNIVMSGDMKTLNDFKLLQLAWIFDMNFRRAIQLVVERKYPDMIMNTLPETELVQQIREKIFRYVNKMLKIKTPLNDG